MLGCYYAGGEINQPKLNSLWKNKSPSFQEDPPLHYAPTAFYFFSNLPFFTTFIWKSRSLVSFSNIRQLKHSFSLCNAKKMLDIEQYLSFDFGSNCHLVLARWTLKKISIPSLQLKSKVDTILWKCHYKHLKKRLLYIMLLCTLCTIIFVYLTAI